MIYDEWSLLACKYGLHNTIFYHNGRKHPSTLMIHVVSRTDDALLVWYFVFPPVCLPSRWQDSLVRDGRAATTFTYSELHSPANDSLFYSPARPHER
ncbi:hypothetical protein E2C01_080333 [Portunus trituberculatus]|uniref:Uncharacterized protein n=1 Tax=Portunus trituberculatus TaxID=210409 RepID=A0A5B7IP11_PORTR|nr:hypothetical protein [Portunus trituberculatus]